MKPGVIVGPVAPGMSLQESGLGQLCHWNRNETGTSLTQAPLSALTASPSFGVVARPGVTTAAPAAPIGACPFGLTPATACPRTRSAAPVCGETDAPARRLAMLELM